MSDFADTRAMMTGLGIITGTATTTVSLGTCKVNIGGVVATVNVVRDLTVAVGDVLAIARQGSSRWAFARLFTAPPAVVEIDTAPTFATSGTLVLTPVETRSYRSGAWRKDSDDVVQGSYGGFGNSIGCAFYGRAPRSLSGATITKAVLKVKRVKGGVNAAQATTLRLVTQATKPAGAPTLGSSTAGPSLAVGKSTTAFVVPNSWAQAMVAGTAGGLAVYDSGGSPYVRLAGRGSWGPAFTLTLTWQR